MIEVFFDVETKNLFRDIASDDPGELGVSIVSVYKRSVIEGKQISGEMQSFWEKDFPNMWGIFESADRIIGFNTLKFDIPALRPYAPVTFAKLNHFDIMDKVRSVIGFRLGLNALARDTLQLEKTDVGTNAVTYWNLGDEESLAKLKYYCEADVALTRDLYDFGMANKHLLFTDKWNNKKRIELDFSYPMAVQKDKNQISLF
jgi:DEAD/DEAH box helicase domain-containing protein